MIAVWIVKKRVLYNGMKTDLNVTGFTAVRPYMQYVIHNVYFRKADESYNVPPLFRSFLLALRTLFIKMEG